MNEPGEARLGQATPGLGWTTLGLGCNCAGWRAGAGAGCPAAQLGVENCFFLFLLKEARLDASLGLPPAAQLPGRKFFHRQKIIL